MKMNHSNDTMVCLLCLESSENAVKIFEEEGIRLNIGAMLNEHFWFPVIELNDKSICGLCWRNVRDFHDFYNSVKYKHQQQSVCDSKVAVSEVMDSKELPAYIKTEPDVDIKDDFDDSCINSHADSLHVSEMEALHLIHSPITTIESRKTTRRIITSPSTVTQKKSKTDTRSLLLSKYFNMSCDLCDTLLSSYQDTKKHYKDVHELDKGYLICCSKKFFKLQHMLQHCQWHIDPDSFKCNLCPKTFNDKYRLRDHFNICHVPANDKAFSCNDCDKTFSKRHYLNAHVNKLHSSDSSTPVVRKRRFDKEHEMIRDRFLMQCDLCAEPYSIFRDAQLHHTKAHNQAGYLYCCGRKFFKMYRAVQHCIWHNDPESFKCSFCQKCYTDKISLRDHIRNVHSPENEREFRCEICKKSFAKSYILRSHMKVNHVKAEDKKFECHICGIRFVILPFLKSHINRVHRNEHSHICELCAKTFKSGISYERHYINFHTNISQKVQCEMCGKWLKHKESLKKHILWHKSKTETCGICGRVSSNIRALRAHMKSAHREASLECTVCGKMFKKQQVLKEHMAIHAGITDLYTCTFCTKTFRSNANMYSHRKRAHPVELEQKKASLNCFAPTTTA